MAKRTFIAAFIVSLAVLLVTASSYAQNDKTVSDQTGTVTIETETLALGIGYTWGEGNLTYRGKVYPFTFKGLSIADVGVSSAASRGEVSDLKTLKDFEGTYAAAAAGATVGGGGGAAALVNQNGVKIAILGTGQGVRFTLGASGVEIKLKRPAAKGKAPEVKKSAGAPR